MLKGLRRTRVYFTAHLMGSIIGSLLLICVAPSDVEARDITVPERSYEQKLDQVRLYINNQMYLAALNELNLLSESPEGQEDERIFTALAKVNYKLHNITTALSNLRRARRLTQDPKDRVLLTELYDQWLNTYGLVRFESADRQVEGVITLSRKRKFINRERREALARATKQLSKGVRLPISLYLPYGKYQVNGTQFKLERNQPTPIVDILLKPLEPTAPDQAERSSNKWLYIGLGSVAVIAAGVGGYFLFDQDSPSSRPLYISISGK